MKKDVVMHELLVKSANFLSTLSLFINNIDFLILNLVNISLITSYEKMSVYLLKQCFVTN